MQKLSLKLKKVPRNAPQVPCSTNPVLNRDQSLSVQDKVLDDNNLDVDRSQRKGSSDLRVQNVVYVLNMRGVPLMPTSQKMANKLLKEKKAKVVKRKPFTIQMLVPTGETRQVVVLGIDSGYKHIGFSATSKKKELISGEVELDMKTKERLETRAMYRRGRRNKLWYRKPRFMNRVSTKKKGWLPPSTQRRYDTHLNLIRKIGDILPVRKVVIEVGNFDIQKLNNPDISGKEYQEGSLFGYNNMKSFLISREKGMCQLCGKEKGNDGWNVHHIKERSKGGGDGESNLALLHKKCHEKLHRENLKLKGKNKMYKDATFMNIIKDKFLNDLRCKITYGYITFTKRHELGLDKSHNNDAFVISCGTHQKRSLPMNIKQKHRNNRSLQKNRKGFKPSIRKQRYKLQPGDLVKVDDKVYNCGGTHDKGKRVMVNGKSLNINKITRSFQYGSFIY
jgi:5-methylcytosine-specific restriction endonuclease McrA